MKKTAVALAAVLALASVSACIPEEDTASSSSSGEQSGKQNGKKGGGKKQAQQRDLTSGQENALRAGQNYVDMMPFSKKGLIQQLSSAAGDGYSKADATFAANNVDANWNAEAVEAAENYLELMPYSRDGLIQQLSSPAGDKFTKQQATQAVNKVMG